MLYFIKRIKVLKEIQKKFKGSKRLYLMPQSQHRKNNNTQYFNTGKIMRFFIIKNNLETA